MGWAGPLVFKLLFGSGVLKQVFSWNFKIQIDVNGTDFLGEGGKVGRRELESCPFGPPTI